MNAWLRLSNADKCQEEWNTESKRMIFAPSLVSGVQFDRAYEHQRTEGSLFLGHPPRTSHRRRYMPGSRGLCSRSQMHSDQVWMPAKTSSYRQRLLQVRWACVDPRNG